MSQSGSRTSSQNPVDTSGNGSHSVTPGEPIAIIGMGCRFPGASEPAALWQALVDRKDCVGDIPTERFPELDRFYDPTPGVPGKVVTRQGGYLEQIDCFDPYFFGVSPREATFMDPQQRLLLEVGWEALEDAGLPIEGLAGSRTGVYVGLWTSEYETEMFRATSEIDLYMTTGGSRYAAAGRMSYVFDLQGPSMVADTACSTSLVTAHLACQALRMGEVDLALAGGVNLILQPPITIAFSKAKMLSPDGRCKFGDAAANGYVRSEGCGVVVLKRLSRAIEDGDRIYATILGSAVNSDGQEGFFVAPAQRGQEKMLREAYRFAGRSPAEVAYVEAHGTGTGVGDPTELNALGAVLCDGRPADRPCVVGSVKTNIGHTESAAGVAGLIKAAMCLKNREIPPTLHLHDPNPEIAWDDLSLRLPIEPVSLPDSGPLAVAGVNSFGISGTNAHVVLEEPPRDVPVPGAPLRAGAFLLPLSARSPEALPEMASKWADFLAATQSDDLHDICYTASARRSHHDRRAAVVGCNAEELRDALMIIAENGAQSMPGGGEGESDLAEPATGPVFVFSGQGPQWWAMGRRLLETEPVYRARIEEIDALARPIAGWSILQELNAGEDSSRLDETEIAQPALFALQMGLDALWRSWGIEPGAIVGHSLGEIGAACSAGVLTLEDAVRVVVHRGRLLQGATGLGKMAAAELTLAEASSVVGRYEGCVGIAAVNSPSSVTLSGETKALEEILGELESQGKFCQMLPVNYAFHSPQVAPFADTLEDEVAGISSSPAVTPLISTVTGKEASPGAHGPDYWAENVRHRVEFAAAIETLIDSGHRTFLELSPHPALTYSIGQCLSHRGLSGKAVASLRRDVDECQAILSSLGALYTQGYRVDWNGVYPSAGRCVSLPRYAWQRERFWFEPGVGSGIVDRVVSAVELGDESGSNLGRAMHSAALPGHFFWEKLVSADRPGYLRDHVVEEAVTYPAAAYVDGTFAAAHAVFGDGTHEIVGMDFERALSFGDNDRRILQTALVYDAPGTFSCRFHSRDADNGGDGDEWTLHAQGCVWVDGADDEGATSHPSLERLCRQSDASAYDHYADMAERGLEYGPAFRAVDEAWQGNGWAAARLQVPAETDWTVGDFRANPGVWDAGFQLLVTLVPRGDGSRHDVYLPVAIGRIRRKRAFADVDGLWAIATVKSSDGDVVEGNVDFIDAAGETIASVERLRLLRLERAGQGKVRDWLYEIRWQRAELRSTPSVAADDPDSSPVPKIALDALAESAVAKKRTDELCREGLRAAEFNPELDQLCGAYAQQGLTALGWNFEAGATATADEFADRLGVVATQRRMFGRVLELLAEDGVLARVDDHWQVVGVPADSGAAEMWSDLSERFPEFSAELGFLGNCGEALADVLRGERDPLELLFSEATAPVLEHLYQDAPMLRGPNELAQQAFAEIVTAWPADKRIRVFEIGAGTGGTTKRILDVLPADRTDYVFTDLSQYFLEKAKRKFEDCPFLDPKIFDVEKDPAEQGIQPGSFDIVLASNVLHATPDLRATLRNARRLLAPNGILMLVEGNQPTRMIDMIFGLTEGWWKFSDRDLRPAHPLLSTTAWDRALAETGFDASASVTGIDAFGGAVFPQAVILARASEQIQRPDRRDWLIFADDGGTGEALANVLRAAGANCKLVFRGDDYRQEGADVWRIDPANETHFERVANEALLDAESPVVVHQWALDAPPEFSYPGDAAEHVQKLVCGSALNLVKALAAREAGAPARLWFVTRGAQPVGDASARLAPSQAALWGFAKVVGLEHPELGCRLLDIDPGRDQDDANAIASALTSMESDRPERWLALRGEQILGARLARTEGVQSTALERLSIPENRACQLQITTRGALDNIVLAPVGRRTPGPGEVEIRVHATGQNFRDVLNVLGMYPGDPGPLGLECSGVVTATGPGVDEFRVGDAVMALARGSFASFATAPVQLVAPKPEFLSDEQAAAIPVVFLTAHYALRELASIKSGDKVLIHAASGGVGTAAVQLALSAGATVFGTAGSPSKRATLGAMGVHHVFDSRSLEFADAIREITEGHGVDVVLNSLAGEFIDKSFEVLAEDGTFVEIGKSGIWTHERARKAREHCSYHILDLTDVMRDSAEAVGAAFRDLLGEFSAGMLTPPPVQTFSLEDSVTAFRTMSQAQHVGKIVITQGEREVIEDLSAPGFRADGTYLITGGLGGLGLLLAEWMADNGARNIVLTGRSAPSQEAEAAISTLRKRGVVVTTPTADIAVADDVARLLADIEEDHPPLVGVIHGAGVLDDGVLMQQRWDRIWTVLAPKLAGATNLHEMTRGMPIELFVLMSSWCSVLGSAGQANHSAANAFLDTLAHYRRADGLPALSINWGAWTEIGAAARADRSDNLARQGIGSFKPAEGINALEQLLTAGLTQAAVVPFDLDRWREVDSLGDHSHLFDLLAEEAEIDVTESDSTVDKVSHAIEAAPPGNQRRDIMENHLRLQVAQVLRLPANRIDRVKSFKDLGLDSLTGLELRNRLESSLELSLPATLVWNYPSVAKLAPFLAERMGVPLDAGTDSPRHSPTEDAGDEGIDDLLEELESISDEEAARMLKSSAEVAAADE